MNGIVKRLLQGMGLDSEEATPTAPTDPATQPESTTQPPPERAPEEMQSADSYLYGPNGALPFQKKPNALESGARAGVGIAKLFM